MSTKLNKQNIDLSQLILRLANLGLDEREIAFCLSMTKDKFDKLKEDTSIREAFTKGLETRARKVEDALFRRATGFEYEETVNAETKPSSLPPLTKGGKAPTGKSLTGKSPMGTGGSVKSSAKSTLKTVIPDVTAIVFWLKNMMPSKWGDEKETSSGKKQFIEALELYAKTNETDKKHETD